LRRPLLETVRQQLRSQGFILEKQTKEDPMLRWHYGRVYVYNLPMRILIRVKRANL
jgi:hypothetical protein